MDSELYEWIFQSSTKSLWQEEPLNEAEQKRRERVAVAVREALGKLDTVERVVIERYHFEGESFAQIAAHLKRKQGAIVNCHRRALRSLRKHLAQFVVQEFGIRQTQPKCVICRSPERRQVEALIAAKAPEEPYGTLMRRIREQFGLQIRSPQTIVGHQKYHI